MDECSNVNVNVNVHVNVHGNVNADMGADANTNMPRGTQRELPHTCYIFVQREPGCD